MEAQRREPELGMLGCDRETFARVWNRVSPGTESPVEPLPPQSVAVTAPPQLSQEEKDDREGRTLQRLVLACLNEAAVYQGLTRRSRRAREELMELGRRKTAQARRLSAAYFLMSGVRYWPKGSVSVQPPQSFFPVLREGFLTERRIAQELEALRRETDDPGLEELYRALAQEAAELTDMIRLIVERET